MEAEADGVLWGVRGRSLGGDRLVRTVWKASISFSFSGFAA